MGTLMALAVGAAGGFALARALEARAHGIPVIEALKHWQEPVVTLKLGWLSRQPIKEDADGILRPTFGDLGAYQLYEEG